MRATSDLRRVTRETREQREEELLAPAATRAAATRGREHDEPYDPLRTAFERDRDRILHSKAFRRLKHKTQVFIDPEGDHYVTRLTHTLQVAQVGRALAKGLGLNETLTEAICLGHDVGHSPFGHASEVALSHYVGDLVVEGHVAAGEWLHTVQSVRVVRQLEPLNLTHEVLDGIRAHSWKIEPPPETPEGMCLRFADRIAYLAHDAEDAMRAGIFTREELPARTLEVFGKPGRQWIDTMVMAVIEESERGGEVAMRAEVLEVMHAQREWMFRHVYLRDEAQRQAKKAVTVIRNLVDHFADHPDEIPQGYALPDDPPIQQAVDYVAGMSDSFAMHTHDRLFRPVGLY